MLTLDELKTMHDKAYNNGQVPREQASDDAVFYWVTQWDDNLLQNSPLEYRGEFNILRKAGRQIMADLRSNPVQVDFDSRNPDRQDDADFLDGVYRADDRRNSTIEAYDYASQDAVVTGFGAWEMYTEYESLRDGSNNQIIKRRWIPEAYNTTMWDPNAKLLDKSDAKYVSILYAYSEEGYKDLVEDMTGERPEDTGPNFNNPEQSYVFPWYAEDAKIYVTTFYHKKKVKDKVLTLVDLFGTPLTVLESDLVDQMDELLDAGYEIAGEKEIERWEVRKYIASGNEILNGEMNDETGEREGEVIACEYIPVIPVYGERSVIEGEEYYSGVTRLAKDPQRLRNFQMSYLADIVSRSPRPKPIFFQEQIAGFEGMYEQNGADNNYPYLLQHRVSESGEPLPLGAAAVMPEQTVPQALMMGIELTASAVADVADPGLPQNIADPDMSGKAITALQNRIDKQSYIYQHNMKHAKRYDGVVYSSFASHIFDSPRQIATESPDGMRSVVNVMEGTIGQDGEFQVINDVTNMEFEVIADIGPSYDSKRQETLESLLAQLQIIPPQDPMFKIVQLKYFSLMDGTSFDDIKEYATNQLILMGVKKPETPEQEQMLMQAQQAQAMQANQPNPAMLEGQARMMEGQAAIQNEINDANKIQIDQFNAETKRMETEVKAAEAGVKIQNTQADTLGKQIDNAQKAISPLMQRGV